jgi:putative SOS response-associated peptidase YedK
LILAIALETEHMCGRAYETYTDEELYFRYLSKRPVTPLALLPLYNLCPTQNSPVLRLVAGERQFDQMRWQLVPAMEPAFTTKLSTINAKSETVFQRRFYRDLVVRQRCIVPLSGFYEWKKDGQGRRPFNIHLRDETIMSVAGIWDTWHRGLPDERHSFSIITTAANGFMREIHDRMPLILGRSQEDAWLDPEIQDQKTLQEFFKPCPSSWLTAVEISPLVNSPKNNTPEVLQPIVAAKASDQRVLRLFD